MTIKSIFAREILDSRAMPTVEAEVVLSNGEKGVAAVPSGASVGKYEALELRDNDTSRFFGKGVSKAVGNIKNEISSFLVNCNFHTQKELDESLIKLDGTKDKSRLGANAILAVSLAFARAAALEKSIPLYEYLKLSEDVVLPVPMMNVINGGEHASNNIDIQEFMIMPLGFSYFREALRASAEVYIALKKAAKGRSLSTTVGDEGGFAPQLPKDSDALELLMQAIDMAGYVPGKDFCIAIDAAASEWYQGEGKYVLPKSGISYRSDELIEYWQSLIKRYPIVSLEDGMAQDDYAGWKRITEKLGKQIQLVGDDLFVTNPELIAVGIKEKMANSVLIKLNQIGTLSEAQDAIGTAYAKGYSCVVSHRSGETEDTFIADFAVGSACGQIKAGAPARSERTAKYNRLLQIEEGLGEKARYPGHSALNR